MAEISDVLNRILVVSYPDVSWIRHVNCGSSTFIACLLCWTPPVLQPLYKVLFHISAPSTRQKFSPIELLQEKHSSNCFFWSIFMKATNHTGDKEDEEGDDSYLCDMPSRHTFIVIFTHKQTSSHTLLEALANCHFVLGQCREGRRGV